MLNKESLDFLLRITDYFNGKWEDPEWGKRPINQVLIALSTHTMANGIADIDARSKIQNNIEKVMAEAAQKAVKSTG
jgi:hypothetical protein